MRLYELVTYSEKTSRWTAQFDLGLSRFTLYFSWNSQCEYWEMSVYDNDDNLILGGIKLVVNIDLFDEYRILKHDLPEGELVLIPRNDKVREITRDNLSTDYALIYSEAD